MRCYVQTRRRRKRNILTTQRRHGTALFIYSLFPFLFSSCNFFFFFIYFFFRLYLKEKITLLLVFFHYRWSIIGTEREREREGGDKVCGFYFLFFLGKIKNFLLPEEDNDGVTNLCVCMAPPLT